MTQSLACVRVPGNALLHQFLRKRYNYHKNTIPLWRRLVVDWTGIYTAICADIRSGSDGSVFWHKSRGRIPLQGGNKAKFTPLYCHSSTVGCTDRWRRECSGKPLTRTPCGDRARDWVVFFFLSFFWGFFFFIPTEFIKTRTEWECAAFMCAPLCWYNVLLRRDMQMCRITEECVEKFPCCLKNNKKKKNVKELFKNTSSSVIAGVNHYSYCGNPQADIHIVRGGWRKIVLPASLMSN